MPTAATYLKNRLAADRRRAASLALLAALHLIAFGIFLLSEDEPAARAAFLLTWGVLNLFWLLIVRPPSTSAALSLFVIGILFVLCQFKHITLFMTSRVFDLMLIDITTFH